MCMCMYIYIYKVNDDAVALGQLRLVRHALVKCILKCMFVCMYVCIDISQLGCTRPRALSHRPVLLVSVLSSYHTAQWDSKTPWMHSTKSANRPVAKTQSTRCVVTCVCVCVCVCMYRYSIHRYICIYIHMIYLYAWQRPRASSPSRSRRRAPSCRGRTGSSPAPSAAQPDATIPHTHMRIQ